MQTKDTKAQFHSVLAQCRKLFVDKMKDYGPAWRILRTPSITDQIFIKVKRIRTLQTTAEQLVDEGTTQHEIDKCVNKYLSNKLFENVGYAEKAVSLCGHELLWGADGINRENEIYRALTPLKISEVTSRLFEANNCSTIYYGPDA